ncbi:MAG: hypothetical protein MR938_01965 [Tenericutes bacterium]|nr:hypothetical protein [Mycoplasmatota bacterium]
MSSRMEKYENSSLNNMSRTKRNQDIYNVTDMNELSRIKTNTNVSIISDASKEIDIEKIKKYIENMNENEEEHKKRISIELPEEKEEVQQEKVEKDYDINSVLERARDSRETDYELERHRKLNSNGYDILKSIKIKETDEDKTEPIDELNTQEKTIVELIQNIQNKNDSKPKSIKEDTEDLFGELMGKNENTIVMAPIEDDEKNKENIKEALLDITKELEKIEEPVNHTDSLSLKNEDNEKNDEENSESVEYQEKTDSVVADKSFYTNSLSFNKTDFEGFEDLEKNQKKGNLFTKIAITLIILMLLATIFIILNFLLDWNIF